jgi:hypothetical protein
MSLQGVAAALRGGVSGVTEGVQAAGAIEDLWAKQSERKEQERKRKLLDQPMDLAKIPIFQHIPKEQQGYYLGEHQKLGGSRRAALELFQQVATDEKGMGIILNAGTSLKKEKMGKLIDAFGQAKAAKDTAKMAELEPLIKTGMQDLQTAEMKTMFWGIGNAAKNLPEKDQKIIDGFMQAGQSDAAIKHIQKYQDIQGDIQKYGAYWGRTSGLLPQNVQQNLRKDVGMMFRQYPASRFDNDAYTMDMNRYNKPQDFSYYLPADEREQYEQIVGLASTLLANKKVRTNQEAISAAVNIMQRQAQGGQQQGAQQQPAGQAMPPQVQPQGGAVQPAQQSMSSRNNTITVQQALHMRDKLRYGGSLRQLPDGSHVYTYTDPDTKKIVRLNVVKEGEGNIKQQPTRNRTYNPATGKLE